VRAELNFADLFVSRELKGSSVFGFVRIRPDLCVFSPPGSVSSRAFIVLTIWTGHKKILCLADFFRPFLSSNFLSLHLQISSLRLFREEQFSLWHLWAEYFSHKAHFALAVHPIRPDLILSSLGFVSICLISRSLSSQNGTGKLWPKKGWGRDLEAFIIILAIHSRSIPTSYTNARSIASSISTANTTSTGSNSSIRAWTMWESSHRGFQEKEAGWCHRNRQWNIIGGRASGAIVAGAVC
jgi:hypothetical protein